MLKITALLTTLALGATASIAMASPARLDRNGRFEPAAPDGVWTAPARPAWNDRASIDRAYEAPVRLDRSYRPADRRAALDDAGPRRYRPTWVALGVPSPGNRADDGIDVHDRGTFTELRLQADGTRARVDRVIVQFADGSRQVEDLDRVLAGSSNYVDIALDGNNRRIDRILVDGTTGSHSALQVFGI
jgi:hypothetical protein